jgi:hypothetical protein
MTVTEVDPPDLKLETMRSLIDCEWVDRTSLGGNVDGWVDDEGMMKRGQRFWHFEGSTVLMAGKCLLCSISDSGDSIALAPYATLKRTQALVAFLGDANGAQRAIQAGLIDQPMTYVADMDNPDQRTVLWTWDHRDCLDNEKE